MARLGWIDHVKITELARRSRAGDYVAPVDVGYDGIRLEFPSTGPVWVTVTHAGDGTPARHELGVWPNLRDAHEANFTFKAEIHQRTISPPSTVRDLLARYDWEHLAIMKSGSVSLSALKRALAGMLDTPLENLGQDQLCELQDKLEEFGETSASSANRAYHCLTSFFAWAHNVGYLECGFGYGLYRGRWSEELRTRRGRVLTMDELAEIWIGCEELRPPFGFATRFLIATAGPVGPVTAACWGDMEMGFEEGAWSTGILSKFTGTPLAIPLHSLALECLCSAWVMDSRAGSTRIFSTTGRDQASAWPHAKKRLDTILNDGRRHGGRQSFEGWMLKDVHASFYAWARKYGFERVAAVILNRRGRSPDPTICAFSQAELAAQCDALMAGWNEQLEQAIDGRRNRVLAH